MVGEAARASELLVDIATCIISWAGHRGCREPRLPWRQWPGLRRAHIDPRRGCRAFGPGVVPYFALTRFMASPCPVAAHMPLPAESNSTPVIEAVRPGPLRGAKRPSFPVDFYRLIFMRSGRLTVGGTVLEPFRDSPCHRRKVEFFQRFVGSCALVDSCFNTSTKSSKRSFPTSFDHCSCNCRRHPKMAATTSCPRGVR